jgi:hypothetical protein
MAVAKPSGALKAKRGRRGTRDVGKIAPERSPAALARAAVLEEVRRAGLLDGEKTEHVSFRAPPALVEAAKREAGIESPTELGILALAMLARPDPVAAFMKRTRGRLGKDHSLEY